MIYRLEQVLKDVRIALDENMTSEALLKTDDIETLSLDDIIRSKVAESVRRVHTSAPVYMLEQGHNFGDAIFWDGEGRGHVMLPAEFMRLVVFCMSDWESAVYRAISVDDAEYQLQRSRFKGLRGNPQKPVCAIVVRPEGRVLEFYSCKNETAQVTQAAYLPYPVIDASDGIDICERCYSAVIYTAAALTAATYGAQDKATVLFDLAKTTIQ